MRQQDRDRRRAGSLLRGSASSARSARTRCDSRGRVPQAMAPSAAAPVHRRPRRPPPSAAGAAPAAAQPRRTAAPSRRRAAGGDDGPGPARAWRSGRRCGRRRAAPWCRSPTARRRPRSRRPSTRQGYQVDTRRQPRGGVPAHRAGRLRPRGGQRVPPPRPGQESLYQRMSRLSPDSRRRVFLVLVGRRIQDRRRDPGLDRDGRPRARTPATAGTADAVFDQDGRGAHPRCTRSSSTRGRDSRSPPRSRPYSPLPLRAAAGR